MMFTDDVVPEAKELRLNLNSHEALDKSFLGKMTARHNRHDSGGENGPDPFLVKNKEFLSTLLSLTEGLMKENKSLESDLLSNQSSLKTQEHLLREYEADLEKLR
jgi:hypothetical protein